MSKYLVVIVNVILLIAGGFVLTTGIWGMNVGHQVSQMLSLWTPTLVTILGAFLVFVALWGVYAVITEDSTLLQIVHHSIMQSKVLISSSIWESLQ